MLAGATFSEHHVCELPRIRKRRSSLGPGPDGRGPQRGVYPPWGIVWFLCRQNHETPCSVHKEYVARRTAEGKSKREIIRCLKRYVAREVYRVLVSCVA